MFEKFNEALGSLAMRINNNKYLGAIKSTFTIYMPFIIIGSFALLLNIILTSPTTGLAQFEAFQFLTALKPAFTAVNFATMSIMSLAIVTILGYNLARYNNINEIVGGIVALASYVIVVPQSIPTVVEGVETTVNALPTSSMDASGLFIGMILTILVIEFFSFLANFERLKIKMPETVPTGIVNSFNLLLPILITTVTVSVLSRIFVNATGLYLNQFIYNIVQAPLETLVQSPAGIMLLVFISQLFWLIGIHGGLIISPIRNPLLIAALAANITAYQNGQTPTEPVTMGFWMVFIVAGGAGLTLSLAIAILLSSKRDDERAIAKLSFVPGLFGISEPMVFGTPLVLNPIYAIPFAFGSSIAAGIGLFFHTIGFLQPNVIDVPFGIPLILSALLGYGWRGVLVQLLILGMGVALYWPFVQVSNRQYARNLEMKQVEEQVEGEVPATEI